jgi:hypothetical protein
MSARNPFHIIRDAIISAANRAYYIKKLRNTEDLVDYVDKDIVTLLSPRLFDELRRWSIRDIVTNRFEKLLNEGEQLNLFRDLDFQITFGRGDASYQKTLGDLDYAHGLKTRERKQSNIDRANRALADFDRVWAFIGPLLQANPEWFWRDAVAHLESHGGIPAE